jgi:hypothetical protein
VNPAEYEIMAAVEGSHWWYSGMRAISGALLDPILPLGGHLHVLDAGCCCARLPRSNTTAPTSSSRGAC